MFHYAKSTLIILCFSFITSCHSKLDPKVLQNISQTLKEDKHYLSPVVGMAALEKGYIYNLRFFGNIKKASNTDGTPNWSADVGNDAISKLIILLFPSTGGSLSSQSLGDFNFGRIATPEMVAILLAYTEQCRAIKSIDHTDRILGELNFQLKERDREFQNIMKSLSKKEQKEQKERINTELDAKYDTPEYRQKHQQIRHEIELLKQEKDAAMKPLQQLEMQFNTLFPLNATHVPMLKHIKNAINDEHIAFKTDNPLQTYAYPLFTVEQVVLAFACQQFNTKDDLWQMLTKLQELSPVIFKESAVLGNPSTWTDQTLRQQISQMDAEKFMDIDAVFASNFVNFSTPIPYRSSVSPIGNGSCPIYDRILDQQQETNFPDCIDTMHRHFANIVLYNPTTKKFNLNNESSGINLSNAALHEFFQKQTPENTNDGRPNTRGLWNHVVGDLNRGADDALPIIRYGNRHQSQAIRAEHELDSGYINFFRVWYHILKNDPHAKNFRDDVLKYNSTWSPAKKKDWILNTMRALCNCLNTNFRVLNIEFQEDFEEKDAYYNREQKDLYGTLLFRCQNQIGVEFSFNMNVKHGHGDINPISYKSTSISPISLQHPIATVQMITKSNAQPLLRLYANGEFAANNIVLDALKKLPDSPVEKSLTHFISNLMNELDLNDINTREKFIDLLLNNNYLIDINREKPLLVIEKINTHISQYSQISYSHLDYISLILREFKIFDHSFKEFAINAGRRAINDYAERSIRSGFKILENVLDNQTGQQEILEIAENIINEYARQRTKFTENNKEALIKNKSARLIFEKLINAGYEPSYTKALSYIKLFVENADAFSKHESPRTHYSYHMILSFLSALLKKDLGIPETIDLVQKNIKSESVHVKKIAEQTLILLIENGHAYDLGKTLCDEKIIASDINASLIFARTLIEKNAGFDVAKRAILNSLSNKDPYYIRNGLETLSELVRKKQGYEIVEGLIAQNKMKEYAEFPDLQSEFLRVLKEYQNSIQTTLTSTMMTYVKSGLLTGDFYTSNSALDLFDNMFSRHQDVAMAESLAQDFLVQPDKWPIGVQILQKLAVGGHAYSTTLSALEWLMSSSYANTESAIIETLAVLLEKGKGVNVAEKIAQTWIQSTDIKVRECGIRLFRKLVEYDYAYNATLAAMTEEINKLAPYAESLDIRIHIINVFDVFIEKKRKIPQIIQIAIDAISSKNKYTQHIAYLLFWKLFNSGYAFNEASHMLLGTNNISFSASSKIVKDMLEFDKGYEAAINVLAEYAVKTTTKSMSINKDDAQKFKDIVKILVDKDKEISNLIDIAKELLLYKQESTNDTSQHDLGTDILSILYQKAKIQEGKIDILSSMRRAQREEAVKELIANIRLAMSK
jgi:hypothetical protein